MVHFNDEGSDDVTAVITEVSKIVNEMSGVQLGERQWSMVKNRMKTRMLRMGFKSFGKYLGYLKENRETESQALLSLLTTHHSYFFREFTHFEFLLNRGLQRLIDRAQSRKDKTIRIWSAACSRGQEVYSLAMFMDFHLKTLAPELDFEIWGTDIDPESVKTAQNGVFRYEEINQSPAMYAQDSWVRGQGKIRDFSKAKTGLRDKCHFTTCNLISPDSFLGSRQFDLIFCRNVYIYFKNEQIESVSKKLLSHLDKEGFLILGISETLNGLNLNTELIGPSIYQHKPTHSATDRPLVLAPQVPQKIIDVLCVDDSPTIHSLLAKILQTETGFNIKARASNGRQALEILKTKKFDIILLDLHMPELDGVGFLKEFQEKDTPVVILSSINRDDKSIARQAIGLGAADYIEKPSLENLAQAGNEIRSKLRIVLSVKPPPKNLARTISASKSNAGIKISDSQNSKFSTSPKVHVATSASAEAKIKVLIVDDSATIRGLLTGILEKNPQFEVVGATSRPSLLEKMIKENRPDVITMDIHMPEMDGVTLLRRLHPIYHIPTVIVSSIGKEEGPLILAALAAGAVDYMETPKIARLPEMSRALFERLKAAAGANIKAAPVIPKKVSPVADELISDGIIVMGASTGGTEALRIVLQSMPSKIPPILIVQHIPAIFSATFAAGLNHLLPFEVREAADGDEVRPNRVLIAAGGRQMALVNKNGKMTVQINDDYPVNRHRPSVDYFFNTVQRANIKNTIAVLLTGMGGDGARGMKSLRDQGARTIAQDEKTCVVYGMPREAVQMGAAEFVLPLQDIAEKIFFLGADGRKKKAA